jgi:hypothetical protein
MIVVRLSKKLLKEDGLKMTVLSLKLEVPVEIPGEEKPVIAEVTSDIYEGVDIRIPSRNTAAVYSLHDLFASGLIEGISFSYKAAEKDTK